MPGIEDIIRILLGGGGLPLPDLPIPFALQDDTTSPVAYERYKQHFAANDYFVEPNQRAVIAWNGEEQIMILQTDDRSTGGDTAMLSVLPLPGTPKQVTAAKENAFETARDMI